MAYTKIFESFIICTGMSSQGFNFLITLESK